MEALEQLISKEERKIDHLMQIRYQPGSSSVRNQYMPGTENLDNDIEKAYEQLAIYKIRMYMGFESSS